MVAAFDNDAFFQNKDRLRIAHGGQAVRDDKHRASFHQRVHAALDQAFRARIDRAGRFVENEHRRPRDGRARDGDELPLPL